MTVKEIIEIFEMRIAEGQWDEDDEVLQIIQQLAQKGGEKFVQVADLDRATALKCDKISQKFFSKTC